jgi:secreted trypsin-like serine protease
MRRAVLLLATMALAMLLASGVAGAIINGEPDGNRHPYVGMVYNDEFLCSGTLISPTVFLTAGHCTAGFEAGDSQVYVTFEPNADFDPDNAYVGKPHTHPEHNVLAFTAFDVGVVVLEDPVRMEQYGRLPRAGLAETLEMNQPLVAVGYGVREFEVGGGPPQLTGIAIRYRAPVTFKGLVVTYQPEELDESQIKTTSGNPGKVQEGACFGDSGGPLFLPSRQRTVLAVFSTVGNATACAGQGWWQRVDLPEVLSWVRSFS